MPEARRESGNIYLDIEGAEERYSMERVETLTPEKVFDARWAMALLGEAKSRLSQEYMAQGKTTTFEALNAFLDPITLKSFRRTKMSQIGSRLAWGRLRR